MLSQALMETEVAGLIGAERHERTGERTAYRNGSRTRTWDTRMGTIELAIHKVRPGTYFPSLLQPRRRAEHALLAVGVTTEGDRQVLGIDVGPSEDRAFWTALLRSLVKRGLKGVRLVISDAHEGFKEAISTVLSGSTWQRCRVPFMRNLLATVPQGAREAIAAIVRTIFAPPDHSSALTPLRTVGDGLRTRFPRAATVLEEAAQDILAYRHLPMEHQRQLHSTNPLEGLNKEMKRRSNVVGIFPNAAAVIRLVGAVLLEQDDEWAVAERRYFSAESMKLPTTPLLSTTTQEILAAIGQRSPLTDGARYSTT